MYEYDKECLRAFLENQNQLFGDGNSVASTVHEAREFLEESMAVVVDNKNQVKEYFEESGMDTTGMTDTEILEQSEVFALPSGRYLIVEA